METRDLHVSADHCNQQFFTRWDENAAGGSAGSQQMDAELLYLLTWVPERAQTP